MLCWGRLVTTALQPSTVHFFSLWELIALLWYKPKVDAAVLACNFVHLCKFDLMCCESRFTNLPQRGHLNVFSRRGGAEVTGFPWSMTTTSSARSCRTSPSSPTWMRRALQQLIPWETLIIQYASLTKYTAWRLQSRCQYYHVKCSASIYHSISANIYPYNALLFLNIAQKYNYLLPRCWLNEHLATTYKTSQSMLNVNRVAKGVAKGEGDAGDRHPLCSQLFSWRIFFCENFAEKLQYNLT